MDTEYEPVIDNWYQNQDKQLHFYVIDIDEVAGVLDIQHADSDLDTMDIDIWYESGLELATEPEHWPVGLDNASDDTDDTPASNDTPRNWQDEPATLAGQASADNQRPEIELQPDAIDEQVFLDEWQAEETTAGAN